MSVRQGIPTIGTIVKVGTNTLHHVTRIGTIGGAPNMLDATCMADTMKHSVLGVRDAGSFEIDYLYDNSDATSDYRVLKALETAGDAVAVEITVADGTKFASTGYVSNSVEGAAVDELWKAKLTVALQADWTVTNPAAQ